MGFVCTWHTEEVRFETRSVLQTGVLEDLYDVSESSGFSNPETKVSVGSFGC